MTRSKLPDRRSFLALGLGTFAVAVVPSPLRGRARVVRRSVPVMGTVAELAVVHRHEGFAHRALDAAVDELRRVEGLMTRFRDDSDVGRANLLASGRAVAISSETADVLRESLVWAARSGGAFDPCLGRAVRLWDVEHRIAPPDDADVRRWAGLGLWRHLEVETGGTVPRVRFHDPAVSLDLGGIAKGYGVDAAARALRDQGVFHALVNVGGDLVALGHSEDGDPWEIGVRHPADPSRLAATLRLSDGAVATSGDYLRYFRHEGRRYHHLLDPTDGAPRSSRQHTLTAEAPTCLAADAAATAVFGMAPEACERVLAAAGREVRVAHRG
ncbi:MAG TPA: FAD:protein FMN transferase [Longimicrobiales bacterium]|jgi:thiamine biosynthesis lipoprotein